MRLAARSMRTLLLTAALSLAIAPGMARAGHVEVAGNGTVKELTVDAPDLVDGKIKTVKKTLKVVTFPSGPLSPELKTTIDKQVNGTVYAYLDGLEFNNETATSVSVYIAPSGSTSSDDFAKNYPRYFVGSLAEFAPIRGRDPHQEPMHRMRMWQAFGINNIVVDPDTVADPAKATAEQKKAASDSLLDRVSKQLGLGKNDIVSLALASLKGKDGFEVVLIVNRGSVTFSRMVLANQRLDDDASPDQPLLLKGWPKPDKKNEKSGPMIAADVPEEPAPVPPDPRPEEPTEPTE
jgi:hypothetical protein